MARRRGGRVRSDGLLRAPSPRSPSSRTSSSTTTCDPWDRSPDGEALSPAGSQSVSSPLVVWGPDLEPADTFASLTPASTICRNASVCARRPWGTRGHPWMPDAAPCHPGLQRGGPPVRALVGESAWGAASTTIDVAHHPTRGRPPPCATARALAGTGSVLTRSSRPHPLLADGVSGARVCGRAFPRRHRRRDRDLPGARGARPGVTGKAIRRPPHRSSAWDAGRVGAPRLGERSQFSRPTGRGPATSCSLSEREISS